MYKVLEKSDRYCVERITMYANACIPSHLHYHKSEHITVVEGTAEIITKKEDDKSIKTLLRENESIFIPETVQHKIKNSGKMNLKIIRITYGSFIGTGDILFMDEK